MKLDVKSPRLLLLLVAMALAGCAVVTPPPQLTETDLRDAMAMAMDVVGRVFPNLDIVRSYADTTGTCVSLHHGKTDFDNAARNLTISGKALMQFGLRDGYSDWRRPGRLDNRPIDPALKVSLGRASARAILKTTAKGDADRPWPERCTQRYWLSAPIYEGDFAFIQRGEICGGLCGEGAILALEYRDGRWRLIGVATTWMA